MAALPWFAFDHEAYTANTMHLTTEEHGAYLLMMLAYYRTEKPLPASDRALASLTKLPMDRWLECKPTLAAFFTDTGTHWHHERIEHELLAASSKHAAAVAKSKAAHDARYGKKTSGAAPSTPQAVTKPAPRKKPASSRPQASPEAAPSVPQAEHQPAHLQEHITLSSESVNARAEDFRSDPVGQEEENPLGTVLPETWLPDDAGLECARGYGMDEVIIEEQVVMFHRLNAQNGTFSKNWSATWAIFCSRWKDLRKTAPAPRVEVNNQPTPENWDKACALWAKGSSAWPRKSLGPEPGQVGCRCPNTFLTKHNIDPLTGQMTKEPVS